MLGYKAEVRVQCVPAGGGVSIEMGSQAAGSKPGGTGSHPVTNHPGDRRAHESHPRRLQHGPGRRSNHGNAGFPSDVPQEYHENRPRDNLQDNSGYGDVKSSGQYREVHESIHNGNQGQIISSNDEERHNRRVHTISTTETKHRISYTRSSLDNTPDGNDILASYKGSSESTVPSGGQQVNPAFVSSHQGSPSFVRGDHACAGQGRTHPVPVIVVSKDALKRQVRLQEEIISTVDNWLFHNLTIPWDDNSMNWQFHEVTIPRVDNSTSWQFHELTIHRVDNSTSWKFHNLTIPQVYNSKCWQFHEMTIPQVDIIAPFDNVY